MSCCLGMVKAYLLNLRLEESLSISMEVSTPKTLDLAVCQLFCSGILSTHQQAIEKQKNFTEKQVRPLGILGQT